MTDHTGRRGEPLEPDFGDDDAPAIRDDAFDAWLARTAPTLNSPPATPTAAMWEAIAAAQGVGGAAVPPATPAHASERGVRVLPFRRRRWLVPATIAAALLAGIGIERSARSRGDAIAPTAAPARVAATDTPAVAPDLGEPSAVATRGSATPSETRGAGSGQPAATRRAGEQRVAGSAAVAQPGNTAGRAGAGVMSSSPSSGSRVATAAPPRVAAGSPKAAQLYRVATEQMLGQADALLTSYRANGALDRDPAAARQLAVWSRQVLASTRLLIDSPAGDDPELRPVLDDLELVLVQILRLSRAPLDAEERALIDRTLRERSLLPRIRTAVPAGTAGTASND